LVNQTGGIFMSVKLRCLLQGCLLVCLSACASTNNSQLGVNTQTNSTANQTSVVQSPAGDASNTGTAANTSTQPAGQPAPSGIDACSLLTTKEVAGIQGGAIKEAKSSLRNDGDFLMSQCFYTAEEFVRSVSLSLVQTNPANPAKQPKDYFTEKFRGAAGGSGAEREKEREREKDKAQKEKGQAGKERGAEEEDEAQVERINGLGDQAYWIKTGPSASLYVLKKNQFLILSIGGGEAEPVKLKKTKALASEALKRLE
jgi:hypothetical protein